MQKQILRRHAFAVLAGIAILACSGWASADPPSRVARLGYISGAVSFSPAGENDWVQANMNRPLTNGDRLWTDAGARSEIQVGGAMIRMNAGTALSVLNLDDQIAQLQLTEGTLNVRVRRLDPNQVFEVNTPNLAFTLRQPGEYRIEVDPQGNATTILVRQGRGEAYGEGAAYAIDARQPYRFTGTGLREYQLVDVPRLDEFDRWASGRDHSYDNSVSARYVSPDVVGYQDLDANGSWRIDASYGNVWVPNRVAADWAPYRDGHWAWIDPWGWTWVDDAPWGFAVSHYGRWANLHGTWGWVPGPVRTRAYYAPALVAFIGGNNFQLTISTGIVAGIAWFALGPRDVYRPSYSVSRGYFENINRSNTVINTTVINNTYNTYNTTNVTNVVYVNRAVPGAVVAVPTTAFVQSQPVARVAQRVSQETIGSGPVVVVPPLAPTEKSVRGAATQGDKPPPRVFERPVVARTAPPAAPVGFAAQQPQLTAKPGRPLDDATRKELKPAAAVPTPVVKVVGPSQEAPPTMRPPPAAGARPGDERGKSEERKAGAAPAIPSPPAIPMQGGAPSQDTSPVPAAQAPEPRGRSEQRGPAVAPLPPRQGPAAPQVAPRQAPSPEPAAQPPESRGRPEQRGPGEPRGQTGAPPPPQDAAQPQAAPRQAPPPEPAAQRPESRGRPEQRGPGEPRGQVVAPPPQRAAEPKAVPRAGVPQPPPQRSTPPKEGPPADVATPPTAAPHPAPDASRGQQPKPAAGKPNGRKKGGDEQKYEEDDRKQER